MARTRQQPPGRRARGWIPGFVPRCFALGLGLVVWLMSGSSFALPTVPVHPAIPAETDEVFVGHYDSACANRPPVRFEQIPGGVRVWVPVQGVGFLILGEYVTPCLQSIGVLGAGRHEIVPVPSSGYAADRPTLDGLLATAVLTIPHGTRPPEIDAWSYEPSAMGAAYANSYDRTNSTVVRLSGNRIAAIARELDHDVVTVVGRDAGDWKRLEQGFPGPMSIASVFPDALDTLYALAGPHDSTSGPNAIWRYDTGTQRWVRHADYSARNGFIVGVLRDGAIISKFPLGLGAYVFVRYDPATGWRTLPGSVSVPIEALNRGTDDVLYGVTSTYDQALGSYVHHVLRIAPDTGTVVSGHVINLGGLTLEGIVPDPSGGMLAVTSTPNDRGFPRYAVATFDASGNVQVMNEGLDTFPYAPATNGSFVTADVNGNLLFRAPGTAPVALGAGGLGPSPICGDVNATPGLPPSFRICTGNFENPYPGSPRINPPQILLPDAVYFVEWQGFQLVLLRRAAGETAVTTLINLTAAAETMQSGLVATPVRLLASPSLSHLYLLVRRYLDGAEFSSCILEIDLAAKSVTTIAMPSLVATDMGISPNGTLYVTTLFGEVLRRSPDSVTWTTAGHVSTRHLDLHVTADASERIYLYGHDGLMASQGVATRVQEFRNAALDHYFMTADAAETASLQSHPELGWLATGESFRAIGALPWGNAGTSDPRPVCRFYGSVSPGPNSHFYTGVVSECNGLKLLQQTTPATEPRWNYEGTAFHSLLGSAGGNCPATAQMVVRFFNGGSAKSLVPNHRYVQGATLKAQMNAAGWIAEEAAFCVPNEEFTRVYAR